MTPSNRDFEVILLKIASAETSAHPNLWTTQNPMPGHCTVVSRLAQDVFGGQVARVDLRKVPGWEEICWHSWNILPNGQHTDFTASQLEAPLPTNLPLYFPTRRQFFRWGTIKKRYKLLKAKYLIATTTFIQTT